MYEVPVFWIEISHISFESAATVLSDKGVFLYRPCNLHSRRIHEAQFKHQNIIKRDKGMRKKKNVEAHSSTYP